MSRFPSNSDRKLGYQKNSSRRRTHWTEDDIAVLRERFGLITDAWLARLLGRTEKAIRLKATQLKIRRTDQFYTAVDVARIFNVDHMKVARWIKKGALQARRVNPTKRWSYWRITQEAVEQFVEEHSTVFDYRQISPVTNQFWRNLAEKYADNAALRRHGQRWAAHEDSYLLNHYRKKSCTDIGHHLRRTRGAVKDRVELLRKQNYLLPKKKPGKASQVHSVRLPQGAPPRTPSQEEKAA